MAHYRTTFFNEHIRQAQRELEQRNCYQGAWLRQNCTETAYSHLKHALRLANQLQDGARKATCMRVLNWLRADMRRAA